MLDTSSLMEALGGHTYGNKEPDQNIIDRFRNEDMLNIPIELTDLDLWTNYTNDDLYVMDKKIREFFKKTRYQREKKGYYKTTASVVFAWIYGRNPSPGDGAVCRMLHTLLTYYCTSFTGPTTYKGKKVPKVYEFSKYATVQRRPYSLRLRLEELDEGQDPFRESRYSNREKRRHGRQKHSEDG